MQQIKSSILLIDDEPQIRKMLRVTLEADNYKVEEADNGKQGIRMTQSLKPDLVLLDLGLPDIDGTEVITALRENLQVPIVVLSVRSDDEQIAQALDLGADDYITKPFNTQVLLARIRANLRKALREEGGEPQIRNGVLEMDLMRHEVKLRGEKLTLSPKEYDLLRFFMINRGKMLTHGQLLREIWGAAHGDDTQYLRVYVGQLRQKIEENPADPAYIVTEPGIGYRMESLEAEDLEPHRASAVG